MARKKISTTIYITPEQNELLKLLNQKTKVPVAEVARGDDVSEQSPGKNRAAGSDENQNPTICH